jgi:anti-sigma factor RsiW
MMLTPIEDPQINAFVDGELDLATQLALEERMKTDAMLREQVETLRQLRTAIREGADHYTAPAALRERVAGLLAPAAAASAAPAPVPGRAAPAQPSAVAQTLQRWLGWRPLVASFALVAMLAVVLDLGLLRASQDDRLLDDVVASHVRSTLGQHLVDIASSEHHTVKPWLSSKLDFSPPVNDLQLPGSVFLGGRVDYLDGHPVAALVYKQGEHVVNAFVWPGPAKDSKPDFSAARGFQTAHWSQGGMNHWVISDVNRPEFNAVVAAIQAADADH